VSRSASRGNNPKTRSRSAVMPASVASSAPAGGAVLVSTASASTAFMAALASVASEASAVAAGSGVCSPLPPAGSKTDRPRSQPRWMADMVTRVSSGDRSRSAADHSVGGGSAIGLAKIIARDLALPILALPTTYSGSEATPIWGTTEGDRKTTGRDTKVVPRTIIYDPELTLGLPAAVTAASGMNAIAHCVEGVWIPERTPVTVALADEALMRFGTYLPRAVADGGDKEARSECLIAGWLAGAVLTGATFPSSTCPNGKPC